MNNNFFRRLLGSSYFYLATSALLLLFYNGKNMIPLAAWLWPVFFLRFIKRQKLFPGIIAGGLVLAAASMITMNGFIPLSGVLYYLVSGSMGVSMLLPFLADKLVSSRIKGFASTLAMPLAWASLEYGNSLFSPFGTFGSMAYTQHGNLPLVQIVSITGIWGIVFLVPWLGSTVNWIWERGLKAGNAVRGAWIYSMALAAVLVFGGLRMAFFSPSSCPVRTAAISVPNTFHAQFESRGLGKLYAGNKKDFVTALTALCDELGVPGYMLEQTRIEADAGAKIIMWSEGAVPLQKADGQKFIRQCADLAKSKNIYLLATVVSYPDDFPETMQENKNVLIDPSGNVMNEYLKTKLVPGEGSLRGDGVIRVEQAEMGRVGSTICYDMDFPALIRQAGSRHTDIMLTPASDWKEIDPIHTYAAAFRAVENGFSLIRSASKGMSEAVDYQGHILAAADYYKTVNPSMVSYIPAKGAATIYSVVGDAFAWLFLAGLAVLIIFAVRIKPPASVI